MLLIVFTVKRPVGGTEGISYLYRIKSGIYTW